MTKIAILGAAGQIAQLVEPMLLKKNDINMVLYLRHPNKLKQINDAREKVIKGDASNFNELKEALADVDLVYANLAGSNIEDQAKTVVKAMNANGIKRLIWVSSLYPSPSIALIPISLISGACNSKRSETKSSMFPS